MTVAESQCIATKPNLRWYQYSLRTLLVFVTLCAIPCSWLAVKMRQAKRQRQVVDEIVKLGGQIAYDWQVDANGGPLPNAQPPISKWLENLLGDDPFGSTVLVCLDNSKTTDADLENLKGLTKLRWLYLGITQITDAGLEKLKGLNQLEVLQLDHTQVTDIGLEHLNGLNQLLFLDLDDTQITDAGLNRVEGLTTLRALSLGGNKLTDNGLEYLKSLSRLEWLALYETKVTDEGVNELQQALPTCKIYR